MWQIKRKVKSILRQLVLIKINLLLKNNLNLGIKHSVSVSVSHCQSYNLYQHILTLVNTEHFCFRLYAVSVPCSWG